MTTGDPNAAWFSGFCKLDGYPVVVISSQSDGNDYWWYCSLKGCRHHEPGEQTGDMEAPDWMKEVA